MDSNTILDKHRASSQNELEMRSSTCIFFKDCDVFSSFQRDGKMLYNSEQLIVRSKEMGVVSVKYFLGRDSYKRTIVYIGSNEI